MRVRGIMVPQLGHETGFRLMPHLFFTIDP